MLSSLSVPPKKKWWPETKKRDQVVEEDHGGGDAEEGRILNVFTYLHFRSDQQQKLG